MRNGLNENIAWQSGRKQLPFASFELFRGGRMTKWKGQVASYAPNMAELSVRIACGTAALIFAAGLAGGSAHAAADRYWDPNGTAVGRGGSGTWNTSGAFWSPNGDGVSGPYSAWNNVALDRAVFGGTAGTVTLGAPVSAGGLLFEVDGYALDGGTLTLGGTAPTITTTTGTATINSILAGSGGLTKAGAGTLSLTGANSFSGDINVTGGILSVNGTAALGAAGNGVTLAAGAGLNSSGSLAGRTVTLLGGQAAVSGAGVGAAHFTGAGGLNASGTVTLTDDTNDYTGTTGIFAGDLIFSSIGNLGEASALGAAADAANGTINLAADTYIGSSAIYTGAAASSNRDWHLRSQWYGAAGIINRGSGTLTLTGNIATDLNPNGRSGAIFNADTADLDLRGTISSSNAQIKGVLFTGSGTARTISVSGANTFTGIAAITNVTVNAASLKDMGTASALGTGVNGNISIDNGVLSYGGAGDASNRAFTIANASTIANDGTGALALSGDVAFAATGAARTLTLGGSFAGVSTLSGVVSGAGNLASTGTGTWVVSGANTFTGGIVVSGGTLQAGNVQAFGAGTNTATVNGGTLDLGGFDTTFASLSGTGGSVALSSATLTVKGTANTTFGGGITGSGDLLKQGTGTLTLTGASTFTGTATINGGVLALDFSNAAAPANDILSAASTLDLAGGALSVIGAGGQANVQTVDGLNITAGSNRINAAAGTGGSLTLNLGDISRTGGIVDFSMNTGTTITTTSTALGGWATVNGTDYAKVDSGVIKALDAADYANKDDAGTWADGDIVSDAGGAANTPYFGTVNGNVQLGGLKYTAAANSTVNIGASQTLGVDGTIIVANTVGNSSQLLRGGLLTGGSGGSPLGVMQNGGGTFKIESTIVDNGGATGLTKSGTGNLQLTGQNTYTGATVLSGGTLIVDQIAKGGIASSIGASTADSSNLMLENGTFRYNGASATTDRGFTLVNGGPSRVIDVVANDLAFSGLVTSPDDAGFEKSGAGTLALLNGSNDYTGVTTVTGGTLAVSTLADGGQVSSIGKSSSDSANLVLGAGGRLRYLGGTVSTDRGLTLKAASGRIDVSSAATTLTVSGIVTGASLLNKEGDGTLVLSGANNYTGGTTVSGGTLRAGSAQAFGSNTAMMTVNAGGTLDLGGYDITVGGLVGGGLVDLGGKTLTSNGLLSQSFAGTITGTGGFTRTGPRVQELNGCNNNYTGKTTLTGSSTLSVNCLADGGVASGIGAASSASSNLVFANGLLDYTGGTAATDRGFTLQAGTGAIGVTNAATTLTMNGQVVGGGLLRKDGNGTLVLGGANLYTGGTRVTAGTLQAGATNAFGSGRMTLDNVAGVTLDLAGFDASVGGLYGGGALGGNVALNGATMTLSTGGAGVADFAGAINGAGGLTKSGTYTQTLSGCASTYTGSTAITGGVLEVACLADGGAASAIGMSSADAGNLVISGGTLRYIGVGGSTDRQFTLGASGGNVLDASGTGAIDFTSTGSAMFSAANTAQTLTLTGTNTLNNRLGAQLTDNGTGVTSLTKTGSGTWILMNEDSTYTGATTINGGVLGVDKLADGGLASSLGASSADASNLIIGNDSTLRYTGSGDSTNRLFTLSAGVAYLESSGLGAIVFTDTGPVTLAGNNQERTIALGGTNTGDNTLAGSIGDAGTGKTTLAKNDSGTWVLTGTNSYTGRTIINDGMLKIGNNGTDGSIISDVFVTAIGALGFNRSDAYSYGGLISGAGNIRQMGSGTTTLTGNNIYTGDTIVEAGTLLIEGNQSAAIGETLVAANGTLGGTGIIGGDVSLADGTLAPGSSGAAGTLTINGDLTLSGGSILSMQFGQAGTAGGALNDLITVKGNLTLDGTLDVTETVGGSFGPGLYRIIDYTGVLTDKGLNVGMLPSGNGVIQTSIANQVNLLVGGTNYSFWDGDAGPKFNGVVDGGDGVWQSGAGNNNWTEHTGNINTAYPDGTLAIFSGTGGTVTVDNSLGQVTAGGMQFATDGYVIQGDPLELIGPQSTIRVGDQSVSGAGYTATIDSVLTGNTQLEKTDRGTLVLNGANGYTGGTAINGGTLRISSDANLGAQTGGLSFNGGTLNTIATMTSARSITLDGAGTLLTDADLTLSGDISGAGSLTKDGAATLVLTGNASHTGGTTIASGTLQIGNGGTTGSIIGNIANDDALIFNRSDAFNYAGSVSGTGTLTKTGSGTLTMTGNSTYTGTTTVNAGQLVLDGGGQINGTELLAVSGGAEVIINGSGSQFATGGGVSTVGDGAITVRNGGSASFDQLIAGLGVGSSSTITVTGAGSQMVQTGIATLGSHGTAIVNILDGGRMISSGASVLVGGQLPVNAAASVMVSGGGARWDVTNGLYARRGLIAVTEGGVVSAGSSVIGYVGQGINNPRADLLVSGAGSRFETAGDLAITNSAAGNAKGSITIAEGGVVKVGSGTLAMGPGEATLNIGGGGSTAVHAGTLDAAAVTMAASSNRINFNHDDASIIFSAAISGDGFLTHNGPGATVLTGNNSYAGQTAVNAGSLYINGDQTDAMGLTDVGSGAVLGGKGIIGGDVTIRSGGTVNPGDMGVAPDTLTINGNLTLGSGSTQNFSFGQANVPGGSLNDLIDVGGDLTLAGTMNVDMSAGGTLDPGVYRVFNYAGALNDGGWTVNLPSPDFYVQTSVDHQVNLVNTAGLVLRYWDGDAGGKNDGIIDGGDGIWQAFGIAPDYGNDDWTQQDGSINAPFQDAAFAVFMGASGTVTVDDGKGAINVSGMQFITDGYRVTGGAINLVNASGTVIRVGHGASGGKDTVATIEAELTGSSQLVKADMGTLILTGSNSYTGGTKLKGGTLQVADNTALGDLAGGLVFDGGVLNTTADMTTDRAIAVESAGTLRTDAGTTLTLNAAISGPGALTKNGAGRLELMGDGSGFTGSTRVLGGTLSVGNVLGGSMNLGIDGRLEGTGTVGATTNAGTISAGMSGVGTLTVDGNYTGMDGMLEIAAVLGDDASATSRLVITGDTAGTTTVHVVNRDGVGAQTAEGIKIIDVGGASNGTFSLAGDYMFDGEQAVVVGAYGYRLYKGGVSTPTDGDWYLRSALLDPKKPETPLYQPGAPLYESYAGSLQQLNKLGTLQQRVGNRVWAKHQAQTETGEKNEGASDNNGIWARIETAHAEFEPNLSTSRASYDADIWKFQTGIDGMLAETASGRFVGGVYLQYGTVSSTVWSPFGTGSIESSGYGAGATLTWYGESGFYIDSVAQINWFDSDLNSATLGWQLVNGNHATGYSLSVETGQKFEMGEGWSLTPQAQLAYSAIRFDDFRDAFNTDVSLEDDHNLIGRLGLAFNRDAEWLDAQGRRVAMHFYGIGNLYYGFAGASKADVSNVIFASGNDRLRGGIGLGGTYNWADGKYSLYGETRFDTSLQNFGDSNMVGGSLGLRVSW